MRNKDLQRAKELATEIRALLGLPMYLSSEGGFVMFTAEGPQDLPASEVLRHFEAAHKPVRELHELLHNQKARRLRKEET